MKKETFITAVVFLVVGFLAGYITHAQWNSSARPRTVATPGQGLQAEMSGAAAANPALVGSVPSLPEGHPPLEIAEKMRALQEQATHNPTDPQPRLDLANLLYDNRRYEASIEWYQRALELDPENVGARTDLGTALFYSGRPQEALREYEKSLETDPSHRQTLYNIVIVNLEGTHDLAAANQAWEKLHRQQPDYPGLADLRQRLDAAQGSRSGVVRQ